jgi:hypothetical protein
LSESHQTVIIGIGHVGGLSNVLQSADVNKPALLSVSNYLDNWPNSVIIMNATEATIYESQTVINDLPTTQILDALSNLKIIAVFRQLRTTLSYMIDLQHQVDQLQAQLLMI